MEESKGNTNNKRSRDEGPESGVVKRLREDLLDDDVVEFFSTSQDLDSFMKSFEEEITAPPSAAAAEVVDADESQPELGYLLEASDDELGLPPTSSSPPPYELQNELVRVESDSSELGPQFWEDEQNNFEAFGFGFEETENYNGVIGEYDVALDGLFDDDSDLGFGSNGFSWIPETLPAQ